MKESMHHKKGILYFLLLSFLLAWIPEIFLVLNGIDFTTGALPTGQIVYFIPFLSLLVFCAPALAAFITIKFFDKEKVSSLNLRWGDKRPYLYSALALPLVAVSIYLVTWLVGLGSPNFSTPILRDTAGFSNNMAIATLFLFSVIIKPFLLFIPLLGEEIGWRGYLLPKLLPLGKLRAYLLVGGIWAIWHAPLILFGFNYPHNPYLGILLFIPFCIAISIFMNDMYMKYNSTLLATWIHAVLDAQGQGIWGLLFLNVNPLLGGMLGIVGITIFFLFGFASPHIFTKVARDKK